MKKKIFALIFGVFLCVFNIFSFTSCSLIESNDDYVNSKTVLTVNGTEISKADIISYFYTYYQSNGNYFANYDESVIEDSFYTWVVIREVLEEMAEEELYDGETNPNGHIYYTKEEDDDVWNSTIEYIYSQISSYEKIIYTHAGFEEGNYPIWLQDEDDEEEDAKFSAYVSSKPEVDNSTKPEEVVIKLTDDEVKAKIVSEKLKGYLFEYVKDTDDDGEEIRASISELEATDSKLYHSGARNQAYADYIASLVSSAKSNGTETDEEICFENEVVRVYNAYYKSKLTTLFQEYYLNEYLTNQNGDGDAVALSDETIVSAFLEQYYTDKQLYQSEQSYISVVTSSDGASLILYHYNGKNYFFTVQHVLVKFGDNVTQMISELTGYNSSTSNDYDSAISDAFKAARQEIAEKYYNAILSEINVKNDFTLINEVGNYYYYDEALKDCYGAYYGAYPAEFDEAAGTYSYIDENGTTNSVDESYINEIYLGYVKLRVEQNEDGTTTYYKADPIAEDGRAIYSEADVKYMATASDVLSCYENTIQKWMTIVDEYIAAEDKAAYLAELFGDDADSDEEISHTEDYIFETIDEMLANNYSVDEIKVKVDQFLFIELEWLYSGDSLDNKISNKMGYVISNYLGENGSWASEFAEGARKLVSAIDGLSDAEIAEMLESGNIDALTNTIISTFGYHIIKIEDIFVQGTSLIEFDEENIDLTNAEFVADMIAKLKATYVCSGSNETLYDYFYDLLYSDLAGTSSSSTYFLAKEYEWIHDLFNDNKIVFENRMSYDDLIDSLPS